MLFVPAVIRALNLTTISKIGAGRKRRAVSVQAQYGWIYALVQAKERAAGVMQGRKEDGEL